MRYIATMIVAMLLSINILLAQELPMFQSVDEMNGLVCDQISSMEIDDYGYIWLGSPSGLCRYDGQKFKLYSSSSENRNNIVVGNSVACIKKDYDGMLWFATEKGVSYFDIITNQFTYLKHVLEDGVTEDDNYQVDKVFVTHNNDIYYFSSYNPIHKLNTEKMTFEPIFPEVFKQRKYRYGNIDNSDCFWLLDDEGGHIVRVNTKGKILMDIDINNYNIINPTKENFGFMDNGNGEYWFGGVHGLVIWDNNKKIFKKLDAANSNVLPPETPIKCFFKDSRGIIWIGTNAMELFTYNPVTKIVTCIPSAKSRTPYKLNSATVIDIKENNRGLLWFGTWKGLSFTEIYPTKRFHNIAHDNSLLEDRNYVSAFASYNDYLAVGCDGGGLLFWKKEAQEAFAVFDPRYNKNTKMEHGSVLAVCFDHDGYCYNGGYNRSVTRIHPNLKDVDLYKVDSNDPDALHCDFTSAILCDSKNRVWILSNGGGLCEVVDKEKGKVKYHNVGCDGVPHSGNCGTCLAEYDENTLLVGSYIGFSVYDIEKDQFITYRSVPNDSTSLSNNWVYVFHVDKKKRIWVGTCAGLNKFDINTGKMLRYSSECGLESDLIKGILEDENGMLWISTAKGISKFDPEIGKVIRTYKESDGILSDNFIIRSCHKSIDGSLFFGTANGFTYFNANEIRMDTILPMPTITGMLVNYERINTSDPESPINKAPEAVSTIELNSDQTTFTLEFASLNFVNESGNQYSYKLVGFNSDWVDIGTRHEITFTNLDQGEYIFLVKSKNSDGVVSEVRPLKIIVHPPFYLTWWFITLEILIVLVIVYIINRQHTQSVKDYQKKLEDTVKVKTEDLLRANKELADQKEEIEKSLNSTLILNDLSRQITSSFDIDTIVKIAYNHIKMIAKMDFFALGRYVSSKNSLEFNTILYVSYLDDTLSISLNDEFAEAECFNDTEDRYLHNERCLESVFRNIEGEPFGTLFILPIHEGSKITGVLTIGCHDKDLYTKSDRASIRMITSYLSIALEKAKDYHQLALKNKAINGSIRYAKTIQDAILVREKDINEYFNAMIIFRPKDIVSGDFYWFKTVEMQPSGHPKKIFVADIDCTGHGVPGAFMSLISNILLNDIVIRNANYDPAHILKLLDKEIVQVLNQEHGQNTDGLDMTICRFDLDASGNFTRMIFAGAKNSLFHYHSYTNVLEIHPADRMSIGGCDTSVVEKVFSNQVIDIRKGDMFYLTSDGIVDQNNKERKRFGRNRLKNIIIENHELDMRDQKIELEKALNEFMDGEEQRDDISLIGLKII